MDQTEIRNMVGAAIAKSMALPADARYPRNAPQVNAIMEDKFTVAYYNTDKRMNDR